MFNKPLSKELRKVYDDVLKEPIPADMQKLLKELDK